MGGCSAPVAAVEAGGPGRPAGPGAGGRARAPLTWRSAAATTVPVMLPTLVWAFQMPMMSPRFPFPNHDPMTDTTLGHPLDWNSPART